jgi:hypothetical protein
MVGFEASITLQNDDSDEEDEEEDSVFDGGMIQRFVLQ